MHTRRTSFSPRGARSSRGGKLWFISSLLGVMAWLLCAAFAPAQAWASPSAAPPASEEGHEKASSREDAETVRAAEIRLHKHGVFWLRAQLDGESPAQRARESVHELHQVLATELPEGERDLVQVEAGAGQRVRLMVNGHEVLEIGKADADAAEEPSTIALARTMRTELEDALHEERDRSALSGTVLSFSLVVFLGLVLFLCLPKIGELKRQGGDWVREHHEKLPHIRLRKVELLSVGALQNTLVLAVGAIAVVVQVVCIYAYIVVCLSLFETTAPWVEQLNGLVLSPFTTLLDRLQRVFPTATLTAAILLLLFPAWRVSGQLARSIERGDVHLAWLPADRVRPTVQLLRMGMVIAAVLVLGPLVSDDETSLVARIGNGALWALTLGAVPIVLTMLWGVVVVFGRIYRPGGWVLVGGILGQIESIELFFVILRHPRREKSGSTRYRIPHLWFAFSRVTILPGRPKRVFDYPIKREHWHEGLGATLSAKLRSLHTQAAIDMHAMEVEQVIYRVEMPDDHRVSPEHCYVALEEALRKFLDEREASEAEALAKSAAKADLSAAEQETPETQA